MFSFPEAAQFLEVIPQCSQPHCYVSGASIDTRTLEPGNLFVAIQSESQDGHQFLEEAFRKGASGALIEKSVWERGQERFLKSAGLFQNLLPVENTLKAFLELAKWHRNRINPMCVGITGSVGKTSTKEFLHYLLKSKYPVVASQGNFNNHLGLPLTLLRLQSTDRYCVAELGANHRGEISVLADALMPNRAIITRISPAHLKGFGSLEGVYEAKLELFAALKPRSFVVIPDDDPVLIKKVGRFPLKKITVGFSENADRRITDVGVKNGKVFFDLDGKTFSFKSAAPFMAQNAGMALVMSEVLGASLNETKSDWDDLKMPAGRFTSRVLENGIELIDDSYNASPHSFDKAIEAFEAHVCQGKKILVFSDMLEMGDEEVKWHVDLGRKIARSSIHYVAVYGHLSRYAYQAIRDENPLMHVDFFDEFEDLGKTLRSFVQSGDSVLIKASRGMHVERVFHEIDTVEFSQ